MKNALRTESGSMILSVKKVAIYGCNLFKDEVWFHLGGCDSHRHCSTENPHQFYESPSHQQEIDVQFALL